MRKAYYTATVRVYNIFNLIYDSICPPMFRQFTGWVQPANLAVLLPRKCIWLAEMLIAFIIMRQLNGPTYRPSQWPKIMSLQYTALWSPCSRTYTYVIGRQRVINKLTVDFRSLFKVQFPSLFWTFWLVITKPRLKYCVHNVPHIFMPGTFKS